MALSMDEQRMLDEIERRLAAEDPGLAVRLSSFKRSGSAATLRSPRSRVVGSVFAVAAALVLSVMVYAMIPFRAHAPGGTTSPQATGGVSASAPAKAAKAAQRPAGPAHPSAAVPGSAVRPSSARTP
jgi:hypothetical protein